jgi:hypothetical protein
MKALIAVALLSVSFSAFADQQCQYYGNQVVCRDMPGYRDAQVNSQIPLMGNQQSLSSIMQQAQQMRSQQLQNQFYEQQLQQLQQRNR